MKIYKSKSLTKDKTDKEIENEFGKRRFIHYETIVDIIHNKYTEDGESIPVGYKVTDEGIQIIY